MPVNSATNAVFAKSRSKLGKCLTQKNYTDLSALNSIPEVVAYLKQHTWYKDALASVKDSAVPWALRLCVSLIIRKKRR